MGITLFTQYSCKRKKNLIVYIFANIDGGEEVSTESLHVGSLKLLIPALSLLKGAMNETVLLPKIIILKPKPQCD